MNILIVSQYFWPENFRINDLAVGLVERGHDVTVLTGIPNYPAGRFFPGYGLFRKLHQDYNGVNVVRVPLFPRGKGGGVKLALNYFSFALFASILSPFLCRAKFDMIFVYQMSPITVGLPAIVLKAIKSIPIIFYVQDLWPESLSATGAVTSPKALGLVGKLVHFIYKYSDLLLIQSRAFSSAIEAHGVDPKRIKYFPNSVEKIYEQMPLESNSTDRPVLPPGFRVMFAGNIGAAQDFPTILDAAAKLREYSDIHWIVLGDGRMKHWVEAQIKEQKLSDNFHLLGRHPLEAMPSYFALADAMLLTLKKESIFALTIPAKTQSYMVCGKPIIAALDGEGARLIEESNSGIVAPSGDVDQLAESVLTMYRMPNKQRVAMGILGKNYCAANFERNMLIDKLENWMHEITTKEATS